MPGPRVVELAPGVWRLPLLGDNVNGFVFRDQDGQVTLLDVGLRFHGPKVLAALAAIGSGPSDVTRLLLTHAHSDHAGSAAYVRERTGADVLVHTEDAGFARAGKDAPAAAGQGVLWRAMRRAGFFEFPAVVVDGEFTDGDVLPVAGGLRVIHTPGHSPGHASFLHESSGVLVTGDAIFNIREIRWPVKAFCTDFTMTQQTAYRLTEVDYTVAAFTHGPELRDRPRQAIGDFLAREARSLG